MITVIIESRIIRIIMDRLKVNEFYQTPAQSSAIDIPRLQKAYFVKESLFVITKDDPTILSQYSLKTQIKETDIRLPFEELLGIEAIGSILCFCFKKQQDLWVYAGGQMFRLQSHFAPITVIASHHNSLISGSTDMTIRIWNPVKHGLEQDKRQHIIGGHTGTVTCFLSHRDLLLSGSADRNLIAWKGTKMCCRKQFKSGLISINECAESQQITVYDLKGEVNIINSFVLYNERKIIIDRIITGVQSKQIRFLNEMDDSFLQLVSKDYFQIAEINIGSIMARIDLSSLGDIVATRCLRRMTLLCIKNRGLFIIKF